MTQKFPFDHFLKLDVPNEARLSNKKSQTQASPVIIEQTLKKLNTAAPKLAPEFSTDELKTVTEALLEHIKSLINPNKFHAYFANTFTVSAIGQETVEFVVTTSFIKKMVETHYLETIKQALMEILGKEYHLNVQVLGNSKSMSSNDQNILNTISSKNNKKAETVKNPTFFIQELTQFIHLVQ